MKYSIIEAIYLANRGSFENIKPSDEVSKLNYRLLNLQEQLEKILNKEQKKLLNDIIDMYGLIECEIQKEFYKEGMKIGLLLGAESLS